jgi:PAS domain S-box-containing protein
VSRESGKGGKPKTVRSLPAARSKGKGGKLPQTKETTKRRSTDPAIQGVNQTIHAFIEHCPHAIILLDLNGKVIEWNPAAERTFGWSKAEVIGKPNPIVPEDKQDEYRDLRRQVEDGRPYSGKKLLRRKKDGTAVNINMSSALIYDEKGNKLGTMGIAEDITERIKAEKNTRILAKLVDASPASITVHDFDGNFLYANQMTYDLHGYTREEFLARNLRDIDVPETAQRIAQRMKEIKENGKAEFEVFHYRKDGSTFPLRVSTKVIKWNNRRVVLSVASDVSERLEVEEALKRREKQLAESQRIGHIGSWEHNLTTGEVFWSDELFCILGLDPEKDQGDFQIFFKMIHPDDRHMLKRAIEDTVRLKEPFSVDYRFVLRDGTTKVLHAQAELIHDDPGKQVILSGTVQDFTERLEAEEKLRRSEEFIRSILDTVDEGFIVVDRDYRILTANMAYCNQVGGSTDKIIGSHCYTTSHKINRPCFEKGEECAVRQVFATGEPHTALHKHPDKEGHILFVETKAYPVEDDSGNVISVIETVNNITERYLLEEERLKTQKLESIGTLAGGIAHDFNNLLQGVFGYISMVRLNLDQKEKALVMLEEAEKALRMSISLTSQLLTFSKGGRPVKKKIALGPVVEDAIKFALSGSRIDYEIEVHEKLWLAEADEGQIGQVMQNIVLNAEQAMPMGGTILVRAKNVQAPIKGLPSRFSDEKFVEISVLDTGIGIPEQYLRRIFDPYFTTKDRGSGLGLATAYSIIKNHGGLIDVHSKLGEGAVFLIYLPAIEAEDEKAMAVPETTTISRKGRILLMDDEEVVRHIAGLMITSLGHEVEFAENGEEAVARYRDALHSGRGFDVAILDLTIRGGRGGEETLRDLLQIDPKVKAVVSSGYSDISPISEYGAHGFRACLRKPYEIDELAKTLHDLLR